MMTSLLNQKLRRGLRKTFQGVIINTSVLINPILRMDVNLK